MSAAARAAAAALMAEMNAAPSQPALPTRGRGLATDEAGAAAEGGLPGAGSGKVSVCVSWGRE